MKQTPGSAGTHARQLSASNCVRASPASPTCPLSPLCYALTGVQVVHRPEARGCCPGAGRTHCLDGARPSHRPPGQQGAEVTAVAGLAVFAGCPPALPCSPRPCLRGGDPGIVMK